jgi:putative chitobiose transport system permease protein
MNNLNRTLKLAGIYLFLIVLSLISIGPFLWIISTAFKGPDENIFSYPPQFIPEHFTFQNIVFVWNSVPFVRYFINSIIVSSATVFLNLLLSSLAGYALARISFKGRDIIFYAILATIMIPFQVIMIPVYLIILKLQLVDTISPVAGYLGLILPFAVNAFGIFLMRQAFLSIPKELEEAAIIDGCSHFDIWFRVMLPLTIPSLATLAIFTFVGSWGEFLWPSIVLTNPQMYTLPVGLNDLQGSFSTNWRYIAAGTIIAMTPIVIFFLIMQKQFLKGSTEGAIKG